MLRKKRYLLPLIIIWISITVLIGININISESNTYENYEYTHATVISSKKINNGYITEYEYNINDVIYKFSNTGNYKETVGSTINIIYNTEYPEKHEINTLNTGYKFIMVSLIILSIFVILASQKLNKIIMASILINIFELVLIISIYFLIGLSLLSINPIKLININAAIIILYIMLALMLVKFIMTIFLIVKKKKTIVTVKEVSFSIEGEYIVILEDNNKRKNSLNYLIKFDQRYNFYNNSQFEIVISKLKAIKKYIIFDNKKYIRLTGLTNKDFKFIPKENHD